MKARIRLLVGAPVLAGCLLFMTPALAGSATASPSVVDQYTEQLPSAGGNTPSGGDIPGSNGPGQGEAPSGSGDSDVVIPGSGSGNGSIVPANGSEPGTAAGTDSEGSPDDSSGSVTGTGKSNEASSFPATAEVTSDEDDGMGLALPVLMLAGLAAIAGLVVLRRRSTPGGVG